jgi:hypothetical protein
MDMDFALRARLIAASPVRALVAQRVTWVQRPQASALPAITLQLVTDDRTQSFAGFDGLQPGYVQIDAWALSYVAAKALKEVIIATLVPAGEQDGVRFTRGFVTARDLSEQTDTDFIFRHSIDLTFHYSIA